MAFLHRFGERGSQRRDVLDDIAENLASVLNTKRGFGSLGSELGIGNYLARVGSKESVEALTAEIETCIRVYEPRLEEADLRLLGKANGLDLVYELTGVLGKRLHKFNVRFNTMYGNVTVERVIAP